MVRKGDGTNSVGYAIRRWQRVKRAMRPEDRVYVERLVAMLERHGGDLSPLEDPLEAVVAAVLVEFLKELDAWRDRNGPSQEGAVAERRMS